MLEVLMTWASTKRKFKIFCSSFSMTTSDVLTDMQLQIIDLQGDSNLKEKFSSVGLKIYSVFSSLFQIERQLPKN